MKNTLLILLSALFFLPLLTFSQGNVPTESEFAAPNDGAYKKIHIPKRTPIEYQEVREADVMWSKIIWRKIDLREKKNHPLYYPEIPIGTRKSLIQVLLDELRKEDEATLVAYNPTDPYNEFKAVYQFKEIEERFGAKDVIQEIEDIETGEMVQKKIKGEIISNQVKEYLVKEEWFFDKQRSVLDVRIIGLCPIRYFYKD